MISNRSSTCWERFWKHTCWPSHKILLCSKKHRNFKFSKRLSTYNWVTLCTVKAIHRKTAAIFSNIVLLNNCVHFLKFTYIAWKSNIDDNGHHFRSASVLFSKSSVSRSINHFNSIRHRVAVSPKCINKSCCHIKKLRSVKIGPIQICLHANSPRIGWALGVKYPLYISSTTYRTNLYELMVRKNDFISPRSINVMWLLLQNSPLRQGQSLRNAGSTINTTVSFRFLALIYNLYNMWTFYIQSFPITSVPR